MLCDDLNGPDVGAGEGGPRGGDICIHIADSLCCTTKCTIFTSLYIVKQ